MSNFLLSLWFGLLRVILSFLHLLYSGLQYFDLAWALFKRKIDDIFQLPSENGELYVSRFVTSLEKCPSHIAVIVGSEAVSIDELSKIVIWCLAAGISFISFYDHTGRLKDNDIFYNYLVEKKRVSPGCLVLRKQNTNGIRKNGVVRKIHLNLLTLKDGKPMFAKLVRHFGKRAMAGEMKSCQIKQTLINEELMKISGFPDPDVGVVCGDTFSTFGMCPWQIRVTEFQRMPSLHNITVRDFTRILSIYNKTEQRFGK